MKWLLAGVAAFVIGRYTYKTLDVLTSGHPWDS